MDNFIKELIPYIIIVIIVIIIRSFVITPIIVRGDSMDDTLNNGEVLILGKISYKFEDIKRYDIIVIKDKTSDFIIKRVIGLPGDDIYYKDNVLYINGERQDEVFSDDLTEDFNLEDICSITNTTCDGKIPPHMYLVLGDNRDVSADSRMKGLFSESQILGKALCRLWPLNKLGKLK